VDIFFAKQNNRTIVPCAFVIRHLKMIRAAARNAALRTNRRVLADLIDSVYLKILDQVECRGNTMINVGAMRLYLDRIRCVPATARSEVLDGATVKTTQILVSTASDAQPVPTGFVKPRVLPPGWSARDALTKGWIRHPVHDWLQPADGVVDLPMPGAKKPGVTVMSGNDGGIDLTPKDMQNLDAIIDGRATPESKKTKKSKTWLWILLAVVGLAVLGMAAMWWMRRRAAAAAAAAAAGGAGAIGTSTALFAMAGMGATTMDTPAIAEAFDNASPPSPDNYNNNDDLSESIF
jgi:hypothetical protein